MASSHALPGRKPSRAATTRAANDLSALLAIASGEAPLPGEDADAQHARRAQVVSVDLAALPPRFVEWLQWPIPDRAYQLYLRGYSMKAIGRELGIDKDTAHKYVRAFKAEQEPLRRANREAWLRETIERLRNVQTHAWGQFDQCGEPALLNTITIAEREIAKLRGLYDVLAEDMGGGSGVTIRISHRGATVEASESLLLAGKDDGDEADGAALELSEDS